MPEAYPQQDSLTSLVADVRNFAEAYLEGVSSTFQNMSDWARDTTISETAKHQAMVDGFYHLYSDQAASATRFAEAADAAGNPGIARIMRDYS